MHFNRCVSKGITAKIWETPASFCCTGLSTAGPDGSAKPTCNLSAKLLQQRLQGREKKCTYRWGMFCLGKWARASRTVTVYVNANCLPVIREGGGVEKGQKGLLVPSRMEHCTQLCDTAPAVYLVWFRISASRFTYKHPHGYACDSQKSS